MAVNPGLAVGLSVGIGVPLTVAMIILAMTYANRSCSCTHPPMKNPDTRSAQSTQNWLKIYSETRPRISDPDKPLVSIVADKELAASLTEKIRSMMEAVGLVRKPVIQEVYVMENGTKVLK